MSSKPAQKDPTQGTGEEALSVANESASKQVSEAADEDEDEEDEGEKGEVEGHEQEQHKSAVDSATCGGTHHA